MTDTEALILTAIVFVLVFGSLWLVLYAGDRGWLR